MLNAVCLNADQTPNTNPSVTNPAQCGSFANPGGSVNPDSFRFWVATI